MCRHEHLLPLLAASLDGPFVCLVYPMMAGGSLQQRLQGVDVRLRPVGPLSAQDRLRIAISICMGVLHLHTPSGDRPVVLHRDIKPAKCARPPAQRTGQPSFPLLLPRTNCRSRIAYTPPLPLPRYLRPASCWTRG